MIILIILIVIPVIFFLLFRITDHDAWLIGGVLSLICLGVYFLAIPIARAEFYSAIQQYQVIKQTIEIERNKGELTEFERASLTTKIIEVNQQIAAGNYYNRYLDLHIPDEFCNLKPLE